ncbi:MAG: J domain-containing protein [Myxococcales bacterium FL481]|nr:MAG: J domain-containing protein [Myxococcales bacterium FL481]
MTTITAYPLTWPADRPRTPDDERQRARFSMSSTRYNTNTRQSYTTRTQVSVHEGTTRLLGQLSRLGVEHEPIISTNLKVTLKGRPRSGQRIPSDPGVAVYFRWGDLDYVMACDRWDRIEDNLAAIAAHIDALRRVERYGVVDAREAFSGFKALPETGSATLSDPPWWETLDVHRRATEKEIRWAFRLLARTHHPDTPTGDREQFDRLVRARDAGLAVAEGSAR